MPDNNFFVSRVSFWLQPDVQRWLKFADKSHTIYTKRFNDILWQSVAVQMYMPLERVQMLRDFSYEHVTFYRTPYNRTRIFDAARNMTVLPTKQCILFGGIALGTSGNQSAARSRLKHLLSMPLCRISTARNSAIRPCTLLGAPPTEEVRAIMLGSVSEQEAHCSRTERPPYHCSLDPHQSRGATQHDSDELRRDSECLCKPSKRTRSSKFALCYCKQLALVNAPGAEGICYQ